MRNSLRLRQRESDLRVEIEDILRQEELFWFQKSRCKWLSEGDRNTKFFHRRTLSRRKWDKITASKDANGDWCFDSARLESIALEYFTKLYTVDDYSIGNFPVKGCFPLIKHDDMLALSAPVTCEEVRCAVFSMDPLKATGIDGVHAKFYQSQWDIVRDSVSDMVRDVLTNGVLDPRLKKTLLVLIPKCRGAESMTHFRPISLYNVA